MMNLTTTQIDKSRTASGQSYDDTGVGTTLAEKARVKSHEAPPAISTEKVDFNLFKDLTPLTERYVSQSPEHLPTLLDQLLTTYDENDLDANTTSLLHRFGIFGLMIEDQPQFARDLLAQRLTALRNDITTWNSWFSDCEGARNDMDALEAMLEAGNFDDLMSALYTYEKKHDKVPFCCIVAARFTDPDNHGDTELFKPFKGLGPIGNFLDNTSAHQILRELKTTATAVEKELQDCFTSLPALKNNASRTADELVDVMVLAHPEMVHDYLLNQCRTGLKRIRVQTNDITTPLNDSDRVHSETSAKQLQELNKLTNRAEIQAFLANPANRDLAIALKQGLADSYLQQLKTKIETANYAAMDQAQLDDMGVTFAAFSHMLKSYPLMSQLSAEKTRELADMDASLATFKRAAKIYRMISQQRHLPKAKQLFVLGTPPTGRLVEKLSKGTDDTESKLYAALETYIDTATEFNATGDHESLKAMQQARFDMYRLQQNQVESEILASLQERRDGIVMTTGDYAKDVETLKAIHAIRQKTVPVRPVNDYEEGVYRLAKQYVWRDERMLPEILADLHQVKTLKDLGYSMSGEMMTMIKDIINCDGAALADAAAKITEPAQELIVEGLYGKASIWQALKLPGDTYKAMEKEARKVVESALEVAEQNPAQFRRLFGDVSLVIDQLKGLVGAEGAGLIAQLQHAATAHSAASCFAGDTPVLTDVDPNSDLAKNIKRFRLLCDMAEYSLHGGVLLNVVKNVYTGYAGTVGGAIGGLVAGPIGAAAGYAAGTAFTAGNAAAQAAGTYAIRGSLNRMTGEQVRMLDKVVNYGPMFLTATSPYDVMATTMRNFGKGDSMPTAIARTVLSPVLAPINNIWAAIKGIRNGEEGAAKALAVELATVCSAVALTAAIGGTLYATGFIAIAGSPVLGAVATSLALSYGFFTLMNNVRKVGGSVYNTVREYQESLFTANSSMVKQVRKECTEEAARLVHLMDGRDLFQQPIQEQKAKELFSQHWKKYSDGNTAKAAGIARSVADQLQAKAEARHELAAQLLNAVKAIETLEQAMNEAGELVKSEEKLKTLRTELQNFGIKTRGRITRTALAQTLQSLKEEQQSIIEAQCGKANPGNTKEEVFNTLTRHYREIMLGGHMMELADLTDKQIDDAEEAARETILARAEATAIRNMEDRAKLMMAQGITKAVESQLKTGAPLTKEALESPAVMNAIASDLEQQTKALSDNVEAQIQGYEAELEKNEVYKTLPEASRREVLGNTRWNVMPTAAAA